MTSVGDLVAAESGDAYGPLTWGIRAFIVIATIGVLAILAIILRIFVWNPAREALRARAAGNWWLPFEARADGTYGPLCDIRRVGTFRAPPPEGRTGNALAFRWGFWGAMALVVAVVVVRLLVLMVAGAPNVWV